MQRLISELLYFNSNVRTLSLSSYPGTAVTNSNTPRPAGMEISLPAPDLGCSNGVSMVGTVIDGTSADIITYNYPLRHQDAR